MIIIRNKTLHNVQLLNKLIFMYQFRFFNQTLLWEDYHADECFYEQSYEIISYSPLSLSVLRPIQAKLIRLTRKVYHCWNTGLLFGLGYVECLLLFNEEISSLKFSTRCNALHNAGATEEIQSGLCQIFTTCHEIIEAVLNSLPGIATKVKVIINSSYEYRTYNFRLSFTIIT